MILDKLTNLRNSLSNLISSDAGAGIIGAAIDDGADNTQHALAGWTAFIVLIIMVAGCFSILLFSNNKAAVEYAIDALKVLSGFLIGIASTYFKVT